MMEMGNSLKSDRHKVLAWTKIIAEKFNCLMATSKSRNNTFKQEISLNNSSQSELFNKNFGNDIVIINLGQIKNNYRFSQV